MNVEKLKRKIDRWLWGPKIEDEIQHHPACPLSQHYPDLVLPDFPVQHAPFQEVHHTGRRPRQLWRNWPPHLDAPSMAAPNGRNDNGYANVPSSPDDEVVRADGDDRATDNKQADTQQPADGAAPTTRPSRPTTRASAATATPRDAASCGPAVSDDPIPKGPEHAACRRHAGNLKGVITKGKNLKKTYEDQHNKLQDDYRALCKQYNLIKAHNQELQNDLRTDAESAARLEKSKAHVAELQKSLHQARKEIEQAANVKGERDKLSEQLLEETRRADAAEVRAQEAEARARPTGASPDINQLNETLDQERALHAEAVQIAAKELSSALNAKAKQELETAKARRVVDDLSKQLQEKKEELASTNTKLQGANNAAAAWEKKFNDLRARTTVGCGNPDHHSNYCNVYHHKGNACTIEKHITLEQEAAKLKKELKDYQGGKTCSVPRHAALEKDNAALKSDNTTMRSELNTCKNDVADLRSEAAAATLLKNEAEQALAHATAAKNDAAASAAARLQEVNELKANLSDAEKKVEDGLTRCADAEARCKEAERNSAGAPPPPRAGAADGDEREESTPFNKYSNAVATLFGDAEFEDADEGDFSKLRHYPVVKEFFTDIHRLRRRIREVELITKPSMYYNMLGMIRRYERRLDQLTLGYLAENHASDALDLGVRRVINEITMEADAVLVEAKAKLEALPRSPEASETIRPGSTPRGPEPKSQEHPGVYATGFGGGYAEWSNAQDDNNTPCNTYAAGAGSHREKGNGQHSYTGNLGHGDNEAAATVFDVYGEDDVDEQGFYQALPQPWNRMPRGKRVDLNTYSKALATPKIKAFSGSPAHYPTFRAEFIASYHGVRLPILTKVLALKDLCNDELSDFVPTVPPNAAGYALLIQRLEEQYGGDDRHIMANLNDLNECKQVKHGEVKDMQALVDTVSRYHASLPPERAHEARSMEHAVAVINKLSPEMQLLYRQYCSQMGITNENDVPTMLHWLRNSHLKHLRKREDFHKPGRAAAKGKPTQKAAGAPAAAVKAKSVFTVNGQRFEVEPGASGAEPSQVACIAAAAAKPCPACYEGHTLLECAVFRGKAAGLRRALVSGAELCPLCLKSGHKSDSCKAAKCETCNGDHHTIIHGWNDRGKGAGRGRGRGRGRGQAGGDAADNTPGAQRPTDSDGKGDRDLHAQAAAPPKAITAAEQQLYNANDRKDGAQAAFTSHMRFTPRGAALSREAQSTGDSGFAKPARWHQFVAIANSASPPTGDAAFSAAADGRSSTIGPGEQLIGDEGWVSLRFAVLRIINPANGAATCLNVLLDDGASVTAMSARAATVLKLAGTPRELQITGYGGQVTTTQAVYCSVKMESANGNFSQDTTVAVVDDPVGDLYATDWSRESSRWSHLKGLPFHPPLGNRRVDMLLGVDNGMFHHCLEEVRGAGPHEPAARLTPAGWTAVGWTKPASETNTSTVLKARSYDAVLQPKHATPSLSKIPLTAAVGLEDGDVDTISGPLNAKGDCGVFVNAGDRRAINVIRNSAVKLPSGRIQVSPLWKGSARPPFNLNAATKEWRKTEASLARMGIADEYRAVIEGWVNEQHAERVEESDAGTGFYLPHFPVVRRDKATTKVRIVANGKASFNGVSLNDCMLSGPKVINSLVAVLLRFRTHKYALMVDVKSMFLRVVLPPDDRQYHRFVYTDDNGALAYYQFVGHIFGSAGSLCIAVCVLKLAALRLADEHPAAAEIILNSSMVDDILGGAPTAEQLRAVITGLQAITGAVGMELHKWCTNAPRCLPRDAITIDSAEIRDKADPEAAAGAEHSSLGLVWRPDEDKLSFKFNAHIDAPYTKLKLLKLYMAVFDPLGLILPFIMSARILYRDLWRTGASWDEPVDPDSARDWQKWIDQLPALPDHRINRSLDREPTDRVAVFSDASQDGYGAVAYLYGANRSVILFSKGRVNSNAGRTMPVLELLGAEIGVVIARDVCAALDLDFSEVVYFTDSMVVLNWLRAPNREMTHYIARKVAQIRDAVPAAAWNFVPTHLNPADLLSRGCKLEELHANELWWKGPEFLLLSPQEWPEHGIPAQEHEPVLHEAKLQKLIGIYKARGGAVKPRGISPFADVGTWLRACRTAAAVSHAAHKWKQHALGSAGPLPNTTQRQGRLAAIALEQAELWEEEFRQLQNGRQLPQGHPWLQLHVVWKYGCIHVYGRAVPEPVPFLPKTSRLAALWLTHVHNVILQHAGGARTLLVEARKHIWVAGAVSAARTVVRTCATCRTLEPKPLQQPESDLPPSRVGQGDGSGGQTVFTHILVDECGPVLTKQGRGKTMLKRWVLVFTCAMVRAVHLEVLPDRTAREVAAAFVRFACRRTIPARVLSDNAPEFGAARELLQAGSCGPAGRTGGTWSEMEWSFYPAYAPNFGGAVEAMVKLVKRAMKALLRDRAYTDFELQFALIYAEYIINERPIGVLPSDGEDPAPLTPNHFLGAARLSPEGADHGLEPVALAAAWDRGCAETKAVWEAALPELLQQRNLRNATEKKAEEVAEGEVVAVLDVPHLPHRNVSLGKIRKVWRSKDGVIRKVEVEVRKKMYVRAAKSIAKIQ